MSSLSVLSVKLWTSPILYIATVRTRDYFICFKCYVQHCCMSSPSVSSVKEMNQSDLVYRKCSSTIRQIPNCSTACILFDIITKGTWLNYNFRRKACSNLMSATPFQLGCSILSYPIRAACAPLWVRHPSGVCGRPALLKQREPAGHCARCACFLARGPETIAHGLRVAGSIRNPKASSPGFVFVGKNWAQIPVHQGSGSAVQGSQWLWLCKSSSSVWKSQTVVLQNRTKHTVRGEPYVLERKADLAEASNRVE
jgi:hypothetical protein